MNVCIISGSARTNNNTIRVAKAIQKRMTQASHYVSLVDFQHYDIPLINQGDVHPDTFSQFQQNLAQSLIEAHVVFIITPEYNWSTTPEILNWLHRFGDRKYANHFNEKTFALVGVSTGKGGKAPALHLQSVLNKIISFTDLNSVVSAKIFESHFTKDTLDAEGNSLGNELYDRGLNDFIHYTMRIAQRWMLKA